MSKWPASYKYIIYNNVRRKYPNQILGLLVTGYAPVMFFKIRFCLTTTKQRHGL